MPRKTLALISGLVIVTVVLFVIALNASQKPAPQNQQATAPKPTAVVIPAHSVLTTNPNPVIVGPGRQGQVAVNIDTSDNDVTAVQLEIGYDPNVLTNVKVTPGAMFTNPVQLLNRNNPAAGRYTYAVGIPPNGKVLRGQGVVADITFTTKATALGTSTQLGLLPTSLVSAQGVAQSVMKSATGAVITVNTVTPTTPAQANITSENKTGKPPVPPKGGF